MNDHLEALVGSSPLLLAALCFGIRRFRWLSVDEGWRWLLLFGPYITLIAAFLAGVTAIIKTRSWLGIVLLLACPRPLDSVSV